MKHRKSALILLAVIMLQLFLPAATAGAEVEISAKSAVLLEKSTRKVLLYKAAHEKLPMASTTKIMTCILAIENTEKLDERIEVADEAYAIEGSSIYLKKNEKISVRDLLYGLMLASGNDAAVALACHVGGNAENFAKMMNDKAKEIGCMNTQFVTPNGLHDDGHYTTAYDLALIACYAMENEVFREIVGTTYYKAESGEVTRTLKNKNKILWEYEGGNGVKTGYTMKAGKCLVFSAVRDSMEIVGVVLNAPDMFADAKKILDYGFENYAMAVVMNKGDTVLRTRVYGGRKNVLALCVKDNIMIPVSIEKQAVLTPRINVDKFIRAPISKGDVIGSLEIWEGDVCLCTNELEAYEDIDAVSFEYYLQRAVKRFIA